MDPTKLCSFIRHQPRKEASQQALSLYQNGVVLYEVRGAVNEVVEMRGGRVDFLHSKH